MNIEISNCSSVGLRIAASRMFLSFRKPQPGVSQPFWGFQRLPSYCSRVPLCPSQWGGDTGAAVDLAGPLTEPSVKLFLRIKRVFTALILHKSHTSKDLKVPTLRDNRIMVRKKI